MPSGAVLPVSVEATALSQALAASGGVLGEASVAVALVLDGVLHFVTPPTPIDAVTWARITAALLPEEAPRDTGAVSGPATQVTLPLLVDDRPAGVLLAERPGRPFSAPELGLLGVIAQRVAATAENGRLHATLAELLAEYMSPDVASTLLQDPTGGQLGGQTRDVSVLFADLHGFTTFSERVEPAVVVSLLNRYFGVAVPAIVEHGGTVSAFIGDAIMGLFGAPLAQPEHPLLAARAALALRDAAAAIAAEQPDVPRLRIGVNTGPATVGNIGSPRRRVFTAIGDTVNLASRLEGVSPPGSIVIGAETYATIRSFAEARPLGQVTVKGKAAPVDAYELLGLRSGSERLLGSSTVAISLDVLKEAGLGGAGAAPPTDAGGDG